MELVLLLISMAISYCVIGLYTVALFAFVEQKLDSSWWSFLFGWPVFFVGGVIAIFKKTKD